MRVLLTSGPVYSHFAPMLAPVAEALREAGHEVAVGTGPALAGDLERLGLPHLALPRQVTATERAADPEVARRLGLTPEELAKPVTGASFGRLFAGEAALETAEDLLAVAVGFRPDLVVRENAELGGYLFAEKIGVPCVTLDSAAMAPCRHPDVLPPLNASRTAFGLSAVPDTTTLTAYPWVSWLPASWYPVQAYSPAHRHYRAPDQIGGALDPAIATLPSDRPLVLAALGTNTGVLSHGKPPLAEIVEALGALPVTGVVALGSPAAVAEWDGARPGNVRLVSSVPQRLMLPACDLFITHAGFGSVRETLTAGVPVVALPQRADQPMNAQRLADLGVGITLAPDEIDAATLAAACRRALADPHFRHAAHGYQRQILALPGMDRLVADLAAVVG
ncbi:MAG TPA: glycosyltransferase [Pseudonocardia sp.]|jgi:N-glycosyltransferase|nr:glycosyltransferase [Pseudonocardia sp.]